MKSLLTSLLLWAFLSGADSAAVSVPHGSPAVAPDRNVAINHEVRPRPGEVCLVCGQPIGGEDIVYEVRGQRIPLHRGACEARFRENPARYLALLQPRGAFLGSGAEGQVHSRAWFAFGVYVLVGLIFGALCSHQALASGRSSARWFAAGLVFNLAAGLVLLALPKRAPPGLSGVPRGLRKVASTYAPQPCPGCGASVHPSACACPECGGKLEPRAPSEVEKAALRTN